MMLRSVLVLAALLCGAASAQVLTDQQRDEMYQSYNTQMREQGQSYIGRYQTKEGYSSNVSQPLIDGATMTTIDGNSSFNAQIACQSGHGFLEVIAFPGSGGDISSVQMRIDGDNDGNYDTLDTVAGPISGVCANGFISCAEGTWGNCTAYRWMASSTNNIDAVAVASAELGGCYCINNSCGTALLLNNLNQVMQHIGTGIVGALQQVNPYLAVSNIIQNEMSIEYIGQRPSACSDSVANPAQYAGNPSQITADANAQADTDHNFTVIRGSVAAQQFPETIHSCDISRSVAIDESTINDVIDLASGTGSVSMCGPDCINLILGQQGNNYWAGNCTEYNAGVSFNVLNPQRILSARVVSAIFDDWIQISSGGNLVWSGPYEWTGAGMPPGSCELDESWNINPNVDILPILSTTGTKDFSIRVVVSGNGEGYARAELEIDTSCQLLPDVITDNCEAMENDTNCRLLTETVDGVRVIENGIATGVSPLDQVRSVTGSTCSFEVSRPFWTKERTYVCTGTNNNYDFTQSLDRANTVATSVNQTGYTDRRQQNGVTITSNEQLNLPNVTPPERCERVCKVRRSHDRTDLGSSGPVNSINTNSTSYEMTYLNCGTGSCPSLSGDEIIKDCQCLDEFSEATAIMQLVRTAGRDMICTSGETQPIGQ